MKTAFETLDESIEKMAERDNKRVAGNATGAALLGAGGAGLYLSKKDKEVFNKAKELSTKSMKKAKERALITGGSAVSTALAKPMMDRVAKGAGLPPGAINIKPQVLMSGAVTALNGGDAARHYISAKKQKEIAEKALRNSKLKGAGGALGLGLGAGTFLASNIRKKEAFEMLDESIEKMAERDNKRVAGNATGAALLGAGGAGLYSANKDKAIAEAAAKKAKSFKDGAKFRAGLTGLGALGTGAGIADKYSKNKSLGKTLKGEAGGIALTALAGGATVSAAKKQKASQELAERAFKNSKLKGAGGAIGLGLGAGTLLASNKKKNQ